MLTRLTPWLLLACLTCPLDGQQSAETIFHYGLAGPSASHSHGECTVLVDHEFASVQFRQVFRIYPDLAQCRVIRGEFRIMEFATKDRLLV